MIFFPHFETRESIIIFIDFNRLSLLYSSAECVCVYMYGRRQNSVETVALPAIHFCCNNRVLTLSIYYVMYNTHVHIYIYMYVFICQYVCAFGSDVCVDLSRTSPRRRSPRGGPSFAKLDLSFHPHTVLTAACLPYAFR